LRFWPAAAGQASGRQGRFIDFGLRASGEPGEGLFAQLPAWPVFGGRSRVFVMPAVEHKQ
jgi:hypothetical protein